MTRFQDLLPWRFVPRHPRLALVSNIVSTTCLFWFIGTVGVRRARFSLFRTYLPPGSPGAEVGFASLDGLRLSAEFWRGSHDAAPGLVLVHGIGACRRSVAANAAWFAARGYAVLAPDLRGHGRSARALHSFGWHESRDVHAAFRWLKERQREAPVAVLGVSMGGAAVLVGPAGPVPADAVVLQAVFTTLRETLRCRMALVVGGLAASLVEPFLSFQTRIRFGVWPGAIAPVDAVRRLRCPVLIVGGSGDGFVPPRQTEALRTAASRTRCECWIAPAESHGAVADATSPAYRRRVLAFLRDHLGDPEGGAAG